MTIKTALENQKMSIYRLAKASSVPYATLNDICNGKTRLEKCSAETIYKIARALNVSMEELLEPCFVKRSSFENFKSNICHNVKEKGDIAFIIETLESNDIRKFFERKWYPESLYLLAMLDYLCRENNVPLCNDYNDLRKCRLEKPVYPESILAMAAAAKSDAIMRAAEEEAILEFKRFNIIENEIRDVI